MNFVIKNLHYTLTVSDKGAEMISLKRDTGAELMWQCEDEELWCDHAPLLFPVCGQLKGKGYEYKGVRYDMTSHGFIKNALFTPVLKEEDKIVLTTSSNEQTKKIYPFDFELRVIYKLEGNKLTVTANIKNTGSDTLHATFGAHPGFNLPLDKESAFESYFIEFSEKSVPDQILLSPECAVTGETAPLMLEDGRILRLRHDLFIPDGIFMSGMPKGLTLRSTTDSHKVTVKYDDMDYLGIWQEYGLDTPFICIEPWCAPPTNDGKTREDLATKKGLFHIAANEEKTVSYSMEFN